MVLDDEIVLYFLLAQKLFSGMHCLFLSHTEHNHGFEYNDNDTLHILVTLNAFVMCMRTLLDTSLA